MKVIPYLQFNGNCAEAVAFYETVFGVKAEIFKYKDAPPSEGYQAPEGTEDYIMHAQFNLGSDTIMYCDMPQESALNFGNNIAISVSFDELDSVQKSFDLLKEGGSVGMEPQETFWSKRFASLEDKFKINWMLSYEYCTERESV